MTQSDKGAELTKHFIFSHIKSGHAKGRVLIVVMSINGVLPVMDTSGKSHGPQDGAVIEAVRGS